jgi:uncharacterized protein involved in exopolysaccharide biosynthesis
MNERTLENAEPSCRCEPGEGNGILNFWRVLRKRWKMIGTITVAAAAGTIVVSLFMTNIYQARAVIVPVVARESGLSAGAGLSALASQFGGLPGISTPSSATASEISSLLKSNILREKVIRQYNLMPALFPDRWDAGAGTWKKPRFRLTLNTLNEFSLRTRQRRADSPGGGLKTDDGAPDIREALRRLDRMITLRKDTKENTITISADSPDPALAAKIAEHLLVTLTNYMSSEAKRVAATNRRYLEEQLGSTADPIIRQKTYNMIAQQIETAMMAEVKENFAFKVIDPPLTPDRAVRPKRILMAAVSLVAALLIGIFIAFFREYLEKSQAQRREVCI